VRLNRCQLGQSNMQKFAGPVRGLLAALAILALGAATLANAQDRGIQASLQTSKDAAIANASAHMRTAYAQLPLIFEANQGQSDAQVKFLARGAGYGLFLTKDAAVLSLQHASNGKLDGAVLRMDLVGSKGASAIAGTDLLPGSSSYFIGNDPSKWHSHIPQFAQVRYSAVYPGIDLIYYGKQGQLEYDFRVAPGSDPSQVKLHFSGAENLTRTENGDIVLATKDGDVRLHAPEIYQQRGAMRQSVGGHYILLGQNELEFVVGAYDHSRELVIDPVLSYSTYLGGSGNESCTAILGTTTPVPQCPAIAVDAISNVYIASISNSANFPNPTAPPTLNGTANIAISKINIAATGAAQLVNSIFLGGNGTDVPAGIAVDSGFHVIVAGTTSSTNFPVIQAYQSVPASPGNHVFVTKIDLGANSPLYSTYLSGNGVDTASGVALDGSGDIYVTGTTTSNDTPSQTDVFPATLGSFQSSAASLATNKFFFTKVNPFSSAVASILYSTYFGGGNPSNGVAIGGGIALDVSGNVYLTGSTNFLNTQNNPSTDFPILNALQVCLDTPVNPGSGTCSVALTATDAFIAKFAPQTGSTNQFTLNYSTYLGGTGDDNGFGVAADSAGDAFVTGSTTSTDFVLAGTTNPFQSANGGGTDAFVAKLSPFSIVVGTTGTQAVVLDYFSYLGGSGTDAGLAIDADDTGGAYVAGYTDSANFPTNNGVFTAPAGGLDAFAARVDTTATTATTPSEFMTYLGGGGNDAGTSIVRDTQGGTLVAGETASSNFPTANPFQPALAGSSDAFITRFGPSVSLTMIGVPSPTPVGIGNQVTFTYTITNHGDALPGLTFTETYPATGVSNVTGSSSGGACGGSAGTLVCSVGAVAGAGATTTVTVLMVPNNGGSLGTTASVTAAGCQTQFCASTQVTANVTDFGVAAQPPSVTAVAGQPATYQIAVNPINFSNLPDAVTLACSSTLPTGASCAFTNNPITALTGPQTRTLVVNTIARTTTTVQNLRMRNIFYAMFLPLSGLVLVGACFGGTDSRKRRLMIALFVCGLFGTVFVQVGCGSSGSTTTVSGTPAGSYNITVTATTGSASRSTVITLNVQ
jgi:hypothetical protein